MGMKARAHQTFKVGDIVHRYRWGGKIGDMRGQVERVTKLPRVNSGGVRARVRVLWEHGSRATHDDRSLIKITEEHAIKVSDKLEDSHEGIVAVTTTLEEGNEPYVEIWFAPGYEHEVAKFPQVIEGVEVMAKIKGLAREL